jgi:beta-N-acetylhexosaminidase
VTSDARPLVIGIPGCDLTPAERDTIEQIRPLGIILFSRNIESLQQTQDLVRSLSDLETQPFIAVDLEGGSVNRLRQLWGDLPSPSVAAASGRAAVRALGEAAGAACRALGIHIDFAPVIDLDCDGGLIPGQGRCLSDDPQRVVTLARIFHDGLSSWGVTGCLKHFPGLGAVQVDTHDQLPVLAGGGLGDHVNVFSDLSRDVPVVMMGHVVTPDLGDPERPASLSPTAVKRATELPGSPIVLSDDLEMGALSNLGDLPYLVVESLRARNHGALVCSAFDRLVDIVERLDSTADTEPSFRACVAASSARLGTLRQEVRAESAAVPIPDEKTVAQLWDQARRSVCDQSSEQ